MRSFPSCSLCKSETENDSKVYRGMIITSDDLKPYGKGIKLLNKAFMLTTKDRSVAEDFAERDVIHRKSVKDEHIKLQAICTYEIVNDRTALDIGKISEYSNEQEVLIGPYSAFIVPEV
ncbi:unnamed protein product [Didymodactylos carnosus]|uniref:Uncharacterized protein n=1 Tax=Didymodactylos carnosus TaxID=1234261 RepID=A0A8S2HFZ4_9BILA|nr:unnamed protein product [Didymodactylos carnosus]CAF3638876.1 unnamed protein product [Didymodactylos carnosus]